MFSHLCLLLQPPSKRQIILVFPVNGGKLRSSWPHSPFVFLTTTHGALTLMITLRPFLLEGHHFVLAHRKHRAMLAEAGLPFLGLPFLGTLSQLTSQRERIPLLRFHSLCASQAKRLEPFHPLSLCLYKQLSQCATYSFPPTGCFSVKCLPPSRRKSPCSLRVT